MPSTFPFLCRLILIWPFRRKKWFCRHCSHFFLGLHATRALHENCTGCSGYVYRCWIFIPIDSHSGYAHWWTSQKCRWVIVLLGKKNSIALIYLPSDWMEVTNYEFNSTIDRAEDILPLALEYLTPSVRQIFLTCLS